MTVRLFCITGKQKKSFARLYEKDSSRMLEQGIKRDDGFSRLMAAVVNDTSVMYNIYAGKGVNYDSTNIKTQQSVSKNQPASVSPVVPVVAQPLKNGPYFVSTSPPVVVQNSKKRQCNYCKETCSCE